MFDYGEDFDRMLRCILGALAFFAALGVLSTLAWVVYIIWCLL